jgi:prevent-host-death family protein
MQVNMHDAKSSLSKLVELAVAGEDVVIARAGKPVARLVAYDDDTPKHPFGLWKGQCWEAPDAWDPDPEMDEAWDEMFDKWDRETGE